MDLATSAAIAGPRPEPREAAPLEKGWISSAGGSRPGS